MAGPKGQLYVHNTYGWPEGPAIIPRDSYLGRRPSLLYIYTNWSSEKFAAEIEKDSIEIKVTYSFFFGCGCERGGWVIRGSTEKWVLYDLIIFIVLKGKKWTYRIAIGTQYKGDL